MGSEIYFLALHNRVNIVTVATDKKHKKRGALHKAPLFFIFTQVVLNRDPSLLFFSQNDPQSTAKRLSSSPQ